jgi:hypothetical protein
MFGWGPVIQQADDRPAAFPGMRGEGLVRVYRDRVAYPLEQWQVIV